MGTCASIYKTSSILQSQGGKFLNTTSTTTANENNYSLDKHFLGKGMACTAANLETALQFHPMGIGKQNTALKKETILLIQPVV
jgi:hypothetical protein